MKKFIKPYRKYLLFSLMLSLIGGISALFVPMLTGRAVDFAITKNDVDIDKIVVILLQMLAIVTISSFCQWLNSITAAHFSYKTVKDMRINLFKKLQNMPVSELDKLNKGDLVSRTVADCENISDGLLQTITQSFTAIITIIGTLIAIFLINAQIALYVLVMTPIPILTAHFISVYSKKSVGVMNNEKGNLAGFIEEYVANIKLVKTINAEETVFAKFQKFNKPFTFTGSKATFISSLTNPCTRFVNGLIYAVIALIGALFAFDKTLTIGSLVALLTYANQYTKPFNEISSVLTEFQKAVKSSERVVAFNSENISEKKQNVSGNSVEFKNLNFGYTEDKLIIENFNLKVEKGQKVAITGKTGSGKTTLVNLLMDFYKPNSGEILIDGVNVKNINISDVMSCVLQDTWMFSGTIKDNISYGKPDASDDEIINACKQAQVHKIIKNLPDGYLHFYDNESNVLSDGEKQLICIARVFLKNPPIIILDEATSSVDIETEKKIAIALNELSKDRTSFIIAHRPETVKNSDVAVTM